MEKLKALGAKFASRKFLAYAGSVVIVLATGGASAVESVVSLTLAYLAAEGAPDAAGALGAALAKKNG